MSQKPFLKKWWRQNGFNSKMAGDELEDRVAQMYSRFQKWGVTKNVIMKDRFGNISEIDVRYGILRKYYIECKNYGSKPVPLSDVAKFRAVLELNGISLSRSRETFRGIFVTSSTYTPRCYTMGIKLIDGDKLKSMERVSYTVSFAAKFIKWGTLSAVVGAGYYFYTNPIRISDHPELEHLYKRARVLYRKLRESIVQYVQ